MSTFAESRHLSFRMSTLTQSGHLEPRMSSLDKSRCSDHRRRQPQCQLWARHDIFHQNANSRQDSTTVCSHLGTRDVNSCWDSTYQPKNVESRQELTSRPSRRASGGVVNSGQELINRVKMSSLVKTAIFYARNRDFCRELCCGKSALQGRGQ